VLTANRLSEVFHVSVTVEVDADDGTVIVVPRRGSYIADLEDDTIGDPNDGSSH
jgi:iron complex transport system ATP-binding protein